MSYQNKEQTLLKKVTKIGIALSVVGIALPTISLADYTRLYFSSENKAQTADLFVAFSGDIKRFHDGIRLFNQKCQNNKKWFLWSGRNQKNIPLDIHYIKKYASRKCLNRVVVSARALKTSGHPKEVRDVIAEIEKDERDGKNIKNIRVITSDYHRPRSITEMNLFFNGKYQINSSISYSKEKPIKLLLDEIFTTSASKLGVKKVLRYFDTYEDYNPNNSIVFLKNSKD